MMAKEPEARKKTSGQIGFLDLPDCMVEQVLEYLSYDEIAKKRIVCRKIDRICQSLLNRGFIKMIRRHNMNLKSIKSQLPRRESERRNHPLAKHSDILTCIETRISMLSMTYSKFIDKELCCFIPGKVIDEVLNILGLIENTSRPLRAHEVLQELRDISSMAIEHFDENIAHRLKKIIGVHHHATPGTSHHHLPFPGAAFIQNEVVLPCDMMNEKFILPALAPIAPKPQKQKSQAGSTGGAPCQGICSGSQANYASIARANHKSRKLRYDVNRIDHAVSSIKREMRTLRNLLLRHNTEMKELRRRLDESETKNLELIANINQLGLGVSSVAAGTAENAPSTARQCEIKPRATNGMRKRLYPDGDSSDGGVSSSQTPALEQDTEQKPEPANGGASAVKMAKLAD